VQWSADFHDEFVVEYSALPEEVQDELQAIIKVLEQLGPQLGRPRVDTLNGSAHANMKEIRFDAADGVWRFAFAFDPNREVIILCGGDKSGLSTRRFYLPLIAKADERFTAHLAKVKQQKEEKEKRDKKEMKEKKAKKERRK
jgi:hypothetical protein